MNSLQGARLQFLLRVQGFELSLSQYSEALGQGVLDPNPPLEVKNKPSFLQYCRMLLDGVSNGNPWKSGP